MCLLDFTAEHAEGAEFFFAKYAIERHFHWFESPPLLTSAFSAPVRLRASTERSAEVRSRRSLCGKKKAYLNGYIIGLPKPGQRASPPYTSILTRPGNAPFTTHFTTRRPPCQCQQRRGRVSVWRRAAAAGPGRWPAQRSAATMKNLNISASELNKHGTADGDFRRARSSARHPGRPALLPRRGARRCAAGRGCRNAGRIPAANRGWWGQCWR